MEPVRFFYSINGTDVNGPVTEDFLRQLLEFHVIGPASYLCQEGETEWKPFNPESLPSPAVAPRPQPNSPPAYVPPPAVKAYMHESASEDSWRSSPLRTILTWACWIVAIGGAVTVVSLQAGRADNTGSVAFHIGGFVGIFILLTLLPYLISLPFKRSVRLIVRATGITLLTCLVIAGQLERNRVSRLEAAAIAMSDQTKADALKQVAETGHYSGNIPQAEANMQKLKEQASQDNSEASRLMRAVVDVSQEIVEKVKKSTDAEKACGNFDPATLNSLADLAALRTGITKLRDIQTDILAEFQNYDDHCRTVLAKDNFSAETVSQFIAGARKAGHIDQVIAIWQMKIKISNDHLARLDFLEKRWGSWNSKDGKLLFSDKDGLDTYNALTRNIQTDFKEGTALQDQMFQ